jgi:gas vesicle protein
MNVKNLIGGILAGTAIGVAIGILLAPASGEETRKKIAEGSKKLADDLKNSVGGSIDSIKSKFNQGVDETARRGKEAVSNASEKVKFQ